MMLILMILYMKLRKIEHVDEYILQDDIHGFNHSPFNTFTSEKISNVKVNVNDTNLRVKKTCVEANKPIFIDITGPTLLYIF